MDKLEQFIGKAEKDVIDILNKEKVEYRVRRRDKESYMLTMDYNPDRVNMEIESGFVVFMNFG